MKFVPDNHIASLLIKRLRGDRRRYAERIDGLLASQLFYGVHESRTHAFALMLRIDIDAANDATVQARGPYDHAINNGYVNLPGGNLRGHAFR